MLLETFSVKGDEECGRDGKEKEGKRAEEIG